MADDIGSAFDQGHHGGIRDILRAFHRDTDLADIFAGKETLRNRHEQGHGPEQGSQCQHQYRTPVPQTPVESVSVGIQYCLETALEIATEPVFIGVIFMFQIAAAQHRHQRQRDCRRHQNRQRYNGSEFMEHQADHAGHEENGNEYCHQRNRNRQNREADFARTLERRTHRVHALLDVAHDIFQHDDGIIDHQADGNGDRQQ